MNIGGTAGSGFNLISLTFFSPWRLKLGLKKENNVEFEGSLWFILTGAMCMSQNWKKCEKKIKIILCIFPILSRNYRKTYFKHHLSKQPLTSVTSGWVHSLQISPHESRRARYSSCTLMAASSAPSSCCSCALQLHSCRRVLWKGIMRILQFVDAAGAAVTAERRRSVLGADSRRGNTASKNKLGDI